MGVAFYEQVPMYHWNIPFSRRFRNRIFKIKWTRQKFINYIYSTVIAKVQCDIIGWNNYCSYRIPTSCAYCNEFDAEFELIPMYLVFIQNIESDYSEKFLCYSELIEKSINEVVNSLLLSITNNPDEIVRSSKKIKWSESDICNFIKERMAVYKKYIQKNSIRKLNKISFEYIKSLLERFHNCNSSQCERFRFINYYSVIYYFDYLEDGLSFIKLV